MIDRINSDLHFSQTAMNLRAYRQEVLASNIANADTPHYKARDMAFGDALKNALAGKVDGPLPVARTNAAHIAPATANTYNSELKYRAEYQGAVDGNTVNMDIERAQFAENAMQFEALLSFVRSRFGDMREAMRSQ